MKKNKLKTLSKKGKYFGELAFFTGQSRTASVVSKDVTVLVSLTRENFLQILKKYPKDYVILLKII